MFYKVGDKFENQIMHEEAEVIYVNNTANEITLKFADGTEHEWNEIDFAAEVSFGLWTPLPGPKYPTQEELDYPGITQVIPETSGQCQHLNKRAVKMQTFGYWFCPDCKADLGDL
jgi:hypothetical protein